jgi:hypothetical protein
LTSATNHQFLFRSMAASATLPADPSPADRHAAALALIDRQIATLTRLTDIGMEFAEELLRLTKADDGADEGPLHDPELAFDRIARAVRMTIALQARLLKDQADLCTADGLARTARAARSGDRVRRLFYRATGAGELAAHEGRRLYAQAQECLRDEDEAALADGPLEEVVARICRALGLPSDWAAKNFPVEAVGDTADAPRQAEARDQHNWEPQEPESSPRPGGVSPYTAMVELQRSG